MTRPSEHTRQKILKAATELFAARGYEGASVRRILTKAGANQAAISYHFGGKQGLYGEVLKTAFAALTRNEDVGPATLQTLPPEAALRAFIHQQLKPMLSRDEAGRYLRIFAWEALRPSPILRTFIKDEAMPFVAAATDLVRRFLPDSASPEEAFIAALWLLGQCSVFVRNREELARPPLGLRIDAPLVERLTDQLTRMALAGLRASAAEAAGPASSAA